MRSALVETQPRSLPVNGCDHCNGDLEREDILLYS